MAKVVLPRPVDGISPALLSRLCGHLVVNFEGEVLLRLQGLESLGEGRSGQRRCIGRESLTTAIGLSLATMGSVKTPTWGSRDGGTERTGGCETCLARFHVLEIHANLAGDAFSEPEVGCSDLGGMVPESRGGVFGTHLECILLLDGVNRGRKLSELVQSGGAMWMGRGAAVARAGGVLGGEVDEPQDCTPRRGWHRGGLRSRARLAI